MYADVPSALGRLPTNHAEPPRPCQVAGSDDNPLTARVAVNHYWETMFGHGIVETAEDFGPRRSAHPPRIAGLAGDRIHARGWDMKKIQRLMVTSATYRQSSQVSPN